MKRKTMFCALLTLGFLLAGACNHVSPPDVVGAPPAHTHGRMVANIQAVTAILESEILMRFARTPSQQFYDRTMTILGRTFADLTELVEGEPVSCPEGTMHRCSYCGMRAINLLPPLCMDTIATTPAQGQITQTPAQMIAGIQSTIKLLEAEILMRFAHTPNQRFFNKLGEILARTYGEVEGLSAVDTRTSCPDGMVEFRGMCVSRAVIDALRERRPRLP